jgi:hypothetical protein
MNCKYVLGFSFWVFLGFGAGPRFLFGDSRRFGRVAEALRPERFAASPRFRQVLRGTHRVPGFRAEGRNQQIARAFTRHRKILELRKGNGLKLGFAFRPPFEGVPWIPNPKGVVSFRNRAKKTDATPLGLAQFLDLTQGMRSANLGLWDGIPLGFRKGSASRFNPKGVV